MFEYQLPANLDEKARTFLHDSLERSYQIRQMDIIDDTLTIDTEEYVSDEELLANVQQLVYITKSINCDVLFDNRVEHAYNENPQPYLEASKDVIKIADGMYLFQETFWKIFGVLHEYIKSLANKYGAIEQEYPTLWPVDLYRKINYFAEFPHQVILAATVKPDFQIRKRFAEVYHKDNNYDAVTIDDGFEKISFGLESAVCDCCYYALQDETLSTNTVFTCYNKVFRNEYSKRNSLDRLINFSVRDIMFVGDEMFVLTMRQHMIDEMIEFLQFLDLHSRIETANDPFFTNDAAIKSVFQYSSRLKYELLTRLNFAQDDLAVGSINLHLDFFGRAFNICLPDGSFVFSGCLGIGFERLVYALYCQYGHDVESWPQALREKLKLL